MSLNVLTPLSRSMKIRTALLALGVVFGIAGGYILAHWLVVRTERHELRVYTMRLLEYDLHLGQEAFQTVATVSRDRLPPCSDKELEFMRNIVFTSDHIRDIGRMRDGKLICTSGIGRFSAPVSVPDMPDIVLEGMSIWVSQPLVSANTRGFVFANKDVSVVLNPAVFKAMTEPPPRLSATYMVNPEMTKAVQSFGKPMPLTLKEVKASKFIERNGVFYQPACATMVHACSVTGEPRRDVFLRSRKLIIGCVLAGGGLGALLAWLVILIETRRWSSQSQFRRAVRKRAINVVYQPIFNLDNGNVTGAEALARWTKTDGEVVAPDVFVPLAESRGFITELTRLVIERVIDEVGDMMAHGNVRISVNITAHDLTDPEFLPTLKRVIASRGIAPSCLGLELTERSTADHALATEALARLKQAGFTVFIDDFGTGYSSLAYLHRLAVDAIKIDRAFTQTVGTQAVTASVVPQILAMARELDLQVVVEGIETEEQAEYFRLQQPGMQGQGWLYSLPLTSAELRRFVKVQRG